MLAITVTSALDNENPNDGMLTLREAIQQANDTFGPDEIDFDNSLHGETITLTQGVLQATDRVIIRGPNLVGGNPQITIRNGGSSANPAFRFIGFNQRVTGQVDGLQGVENLRIENFGTAIVAQDIADDTNGTSYDPDSAFVVSGNVFDSNDQGVLLDGGALLYQIYDNTFLGDGGSGSGVRLNNVDQTLINLPALSKPTIGGLGLGNTITNYGSGIRITSSFQPDLQVIHNTLGTPANGNGRGIQSDGASEGGRIANNVIDSNNGEGIFMQSSDDYLIEDNTISNNQGIGIRLTQASERHTIRGNIFDDNGNDGITLDSTFFSGNHSAGVEISENQFLNMAPGALPIDLRDNGFTANDTGDFDTLADGPNRFLNHPIIDGANAISNPVSIELSDAT